MIEKIIIDKDTISLLNGFYHNTSYAGELRIHLLDRIIFGGEHTTLSLVMEKEEGKFEYEVNNSSYKFYLEFSCKVPIQPHPKKEYVYFHHFDEAFEPSFNETTIADLITNCIDQNEFSEVCKAFFQDDIKIEVGEIDN